MRVSVGGNGKLAHDRSQHIGGSSMKGPGVDIVYSSGAGLMRSAELWLLRSVKWYCRSLDRRIQNYNTWFLGESLRQQIG